MSLKNLLRKKRNKLLFTTPSHSGQLFIYPKLRQLYRLDISETDCFEPEKFLKISQEKSAKIYGTNQTIYLTNGSTSGIIAAVLSCVSAGDNVLLWSNSHPCHRNAVKLAGANAVFYDIDYDKDWRIPKPAEPDLIEKYLKSNKISAVIITSPTYEGVVSDIAEISKLCRNYGAKLIVDEAHGALYPFFDELPQSAVKIADFTVQSLHKTAGGLNPTALLHNNTDIDAIQAFSMINTTSPSYPLLASIEANINFLNSCRAKKIFKRLTTEISDVIKHANCEVFCPDITKLNIKLAEMSGYELSELLYNKYNIEDERTNEKSTLLLCGIGTSTNKLKRLGKVLKSLNRE